MSEDERHKCIGRAYEQRKTARAEFEKWQRVVREIGGRLRALGTQLERHHAGDVTKEVADGTLTFRQDGRIVGIPTPYPTEDDILSAVNEMDRWATEVARLDAILS